MVNIYDGNNVMRRATEKRDSWGPPLMTMRQRYEAACAAPAGTEIWVWDGRQHNERRRDIYPAYKMNRSPMAEDIFAQIRLWREVLGHTPVVQIEVHGWEADDVIGTLVRKMPGRARVHTNDMDYGQIGHLCQLTGVNMKGVEPARIALYKALVGDTSDNIAGIPGFGPGRWEGLKDHWGQIERAIVQGNPAAFADIPFKPKVAAWLTEQANVDLLQQMLTVTHFHNVPDDELNGGITTGTLDRIKAHARLSEFFL